MKIFIGLFEIAGYFSSLKKGFQELGIECSFISLLPHQFEYEEHGEVNSFVKAIRAIELKKSKKNKGYQKFFLELFEFFFRIPLFILMLAKFDIFIFSRGESFLFFLDLPLLKILNKKIIFIFTGSDSRPPYINGYFISEHKFESLEKCYQYTILQKTRITIIELFSDIIINHPPQAHFNKKRFIQWLAIGIPNEQPFLPPDTSGNVSGPDKIRILHSPSTPWTKGSDKIRQIVTGLSKKYPIDYREVSGKPHPVILSEIQKCDFIIDELYSDTAMAGLATEAAWAAKPSVVGGYYADISNDIPHDYLPPTVYCHPSKIHAEIEKMISDKQYREECGRKAYEFVQKNWKAVLVAQKIVRLTEGEIPDNWYYDPNRLRYIFGTGISKNRLKLILTEYVKKYGIQALRLSDKPELENNFITFLQDGYHDGQ
jgi:hypothetical protein